MEGLGTRVLPPVAARRGVTLAEQLAASSNLRDLLKLRDDDAGGGGGGDARQLGTRRRTLLDVIRGDGGVSRGAPAPAPTPTSSSSPGVVSVTAPVAVAGAARARQGERRVSLMALLGQAERQWTTRGAGGEWVRVEEEDAATAAEEELETGRKSGSVGGRCCVCMARGKGAAFIPCGHTFCRSCARELRSGRGRCPLCNSAIREVLDLF